LPMTTDLSCVRRCRCARSGADAASLSRRRPSCPSRCDALSPGNYGDRYFDRLPSREKAVGIYAAGLLLQLPVPGARFCCNSMPYDHVDIFNKILTRTNAAHDFCAISTEIARPVHSKTSTQWYHPGCVETSTEAHVVTPGKSNALLFLRSRGW
jgi:hypothetical protein